MRARAALALAAGALALAAPSGAVAAGAPQVLESWVTDVTATSASLRASINPNGLTSTYRFEYVKQAAFEASGWATAQKAPPSGAAPLGAGTTALKVVQSIGALGPLTAYRYRVVASNSAGTMIGSEHVLATEEATNAFRLPDGRGWELVSPVDKAGGAIAAPGALFGGGDLQAAAAQATISYGSATAFAGASSAPPASQYLSTRTGEGWRTESVSPPLLSGSYGDRPDGAPYRLFSADLSRGLLFGGLPCRGGLPGCPAPTPVLPTSGALPGFMAYYLRDSATGAFSSVLGAADLAHTLVSAEAFAVDFLAASPDLSHLLLSSCAALTADATEVLAGSGECDPEETNLYARSSAGLKLINLLPEAVTGTPGARIAASNGAVSADGSRVYWTTSGNLYLRDGSATVQVDKAQGGGGAFQVASADGGIALFLKEGHLFRFSAATKAATDLTPAGGVTGALGASGDAAIVYYQDALGIERWNAGATTQVAPGAGAAAASDYPPATGTSRVSADGSHLAFLSAKELTGYDSAGQVEAFLYGPPPSGGSPRLVCASCNPTGERPQGAASIPGALANGSLSAYRPRALSADGSRLFFDSGDDLLPQDTNDRMDVYEWEAEGAGDCTRSPGCVGLISSGRSVEGAGFVDASAAGSDAYFVTDGSLVASDPGSIDLYDARVGGGFAIPPKPIPCVADACQALPAPPEDPDPGSLVKNAGNPPLRVEAETRKKHGKKKHHGKKHHGRGHHGGKRKRLRTSRRGGREGR